MADTRTQLGIELWIVRRFLPKKYGQLFEKKQLQLLWGGKFQFDAVSDDTKIALCISTSQARTAGGKYAIGKYNKIKADALYLLAAVGVSRRILAFTDLGMVHHFEKEQQRGRFPLDIELLPIDLPKALRSRLQFSVITASNEVRPRKRSSKTAPQRTALPRGQAKSTSRRAGI